MLIQAGSNIRHASLKRRQTALHGAVIHGNTLCVGTLLEAGSNPDCQDYLYKTPLLHAVNRSLSNCVKLLIR